MAIGGYLRYDPLHTVLVFRRLEYNVMHRLNLGIRGKWDITEQDRHSTNVMKKNYKTFLQNILAFLPNMVRLMEIKLEVCWTHSTLKRCSYVSMKMLSPRKRKLSSTWLKNLATFTVSLPPAHQENSSASMSSSKEPQIWWFTSQQSGVGSTWERGDEGDHGTSIYANKDTEASKSNFRVDCYCHTVP